MTTLPRYSGARDIFQQLEDVRARRWTLGMSAGLLAASTVAIVCVLVTAAALGYWPDQPPAALRWSMLAAAMAALLASAGFFVLRPAVWKQNPAQTARFIETNLPELRNDLINTVLLCGDESQSSPELVQLAIYEALLRSRHVDVRKSVSRRAVTRWALAAGVAAVLLAGFAALQPGPLRRGLMAAIVPTGYVERFNRIELLSVSPADGDTCFVGEPVNIVATIANPDRTQHQAEVIFKDSPPRVMLAGENDAVFVLAGRKFEQSFEFAVRIGPSRWPADKPYYKVNVLQRVKIDGLDLHYEYPSYTGVKAQTVRNAPGAIEAPVGTRVTVSLRTGSPVKSVLLERQDAARLTMAPGPERRSFAANIDVLESGAYRVVIQDTRQQLPDPESGGGDGFAAGSPSALRGYFPINALPDAPPKIEFITPNRDCDLAPGAKLPTLIRVFDKYGLTDARFYAGKQGSEPREVHGFGGLVSGKTKADLPFTLEMPPGTAKGDVVVYYATVTDNRSLPKVAGPQTTASQRFKVTVQDAAEVAAEKAKRYDELRARLTAILQWQLTAHVDTGICWKKHKDLPALLATAKTVQAAQKRIRADLLDLAEKFPFEKEMTTVQQAVAVLANNEARLAVDQAGVLVQLADLAQRDKSCKLLSGTQDQIIDTLQTLLAIMPSLNGGLKEKEKGPKPGDLPPETVEKLKALDEKLAAFLEDQKKVIAATERLNKKPVDNLTAEDEKLLQDLAAVEDKWEKFMAETFADFSRLVEQDFANPSTLKELLAVKSDITMAKDALSKKATEIATAAEDGALGGGEEIKDNLEKWLPDTPDRTKWAMESMPDDQGKIEAPELPKELEDLVGDLLEQEEEMFDEMEDLSARAASSGSDGMGWDAMDGPISNMGAQGVTGNQLPNNNELQGRSGQGRSGKSSGEFVGDSAEDKGGRRTPTRVTPEPFQTGQVDDKSKEPPGGATGGGKLSGSGEEGLEGPVPPEIAKEMPRLAQKQAALVNKAERMQGQFQVNDYAGFKFLQAITLMGRVQRDLDKGKYQNVLRARQQTISALRQSKLRIGQIDVAQDASAEMPKYVRDDIADAMKGKLPSEFRDVLQQYYRRLSETPATSR